MKIFVIQHSHWCEAISDITGIKFDLDEAKTFAENSFPNNSYYSYAEVHEFDGETPIKTYTYDKENGEWE